MSKESDIAALIGMLEKIVTECASTERGQTQAAQVEFLIRHIQSGQADPNVVVALLAFNGAKIEQARFRQRSTDSPEQARTGLAARGMKLADEVFAQLSPAQRDQLSQELAASDGAGRLTPGRLN